MTAFIKFRIRGEWQLPAVQPFATASIVRKRLLVESPNVGLAHALVMLLNISERLLANSSRRKRLALCAIYHQAHRHAVVGQTHKVSGINAPELTPDKRGILRTNPETQKCPNVPKDGVEHRAFDLARVLTSQYQPDFELSQLAQH